ncbi:hypothetical protein COOONC_19433 [Cooperia oncophora]
MRKYNFISAAIDDWLLPTDYYPMNDDVSFNESLYSNSSLYTFANMAYDNLPSRWHMRCAQTDKTRALLICIYKQKFLTTQSCTKWETRTQTLRAAIGRTTSGKHLGVPTHMRRPSLQCTHRDFRLALIPRFPR